MNKEGKTALQVAQENKFAEMEELIQDAMDGKTGKFDHIKIDWGLQEVWVWLVNCVCVCLSMCSSILSSCVAI